jgi:hypothetical protein
MRQIGLGQTLCVVLVPEVSFHRRLLSQKA